jgi:hypothetical protein
MLGMANEQAARPRPPATTTMARLQIMFIPCREFVPFNRSIPKQHLMDRRSQSEVERPYKSLAQYANFRIRKIFI